MRHLPVMLLLFADHSGAPLAHLNEERKTIRDLLKPYVQQGRLWIEHEAHTTYGEAEQKLEEQFARQVIIFHYGGHALGQQLFWEDGQTEIKHLAESLGRQPHLKLVFLNACSTLQQAQAYLEAGAPALIVTDLPVEDPRATAYATHFYQRFCAGASLREAYEFACRSIVNKKAPDEDIAPIILRAGREEDHWQETTKQRWLLLVQQGREDVLDWQLGELLLQETLRQGSFSYLRRELELTGQHYFQSEHVLPVQIVEKAPDGTIVPSVEWKPEQPHEFHLWQWIHYLRSQSTTHAVLLGEGGSGKTLSLFSIWGMSLLPEYGLGRTVPIYIRLSDYHLSKPQDEEDFLLQQITKNYFEPNQVTADLRDELLTLFRQPLQPKPDFSPSVLLLLDGFNELAGQESGKNPVLRQIEDFRKRFPGLQIIIGSRYQDRYPILQSFRQMELQPLEEGIIKLYLEQQSIGKEFDFLSPWEYAEEESAFRRLLRHPLSLRLYVQTARFNHQYQNHSSFDFKPQAVSLGELLWNFHQTELVRIHEQGHPDYHWKRFLLLDLLPYISFCIGLFNWREYSFQQMRQLATSIRAAYLEDQANTLALHPDILEPFLAHFARAGEDEASRDDRFADWMLRSMEEELNAFYFDSASQSYRFKHDYFKDYYTAYTIIRNLVEDADDPQNYDLGLRMTLLSTPILRLIGEIVGDHHNRPQYDEERGRYSLDHYQPTVLDEVMERWREKWDEEEVGNLFHNLFAIWQLSRGSLAGMDLSLLQLNRVRFDDKVFYLAGKRGYLSARFDGSCLHASSFNGYGHERGFNAALFSSVYPSIDGRQDQIICQADGTLLATRSRKNDLRIWQILPNGQFLRIMWRHLNISRAGFIPGEQAYWLLESGVGEQGFFRRLYTAKIGQPAYRDPLLFHGVMDDNFYPLPEQKQMLVRESNNRLTLLQLPELEVVATREPVSTAVTQLIVPAGQDTFFSVDQEGEIAEWRKDNLERVDVVHLGASFAAQPVLYHCRYDGQRYFYLLDRNWLSSIQVRNLDGESSAPTAIPPAVIQFDWRNKQIVSRRPLSKDSHPILIGQTLFIWEVHPAEELRKAHRFIHFGSGQLVAELTQASLPGMQERLYLLPNAKQPTFLVFPRSAEEGFGLFHLHRMEWLPNVHLPLDQLQFTLNPDRQRLVSTDKFGFVTEWDLRSGQRLRYFEPERTGGKDQALVTYLPDGRQLIIGLPDGTLVRVDQQDDPQIMAEGAVQEIQALVHDRASGDLIWALGDNTVQRFSRQYGAFIQDIKAFTFGSITALRATNLGQRIRVGNSSGYTKKLYNHWFGGGYWAGFPLHFSNYPITALADSAELDHVLTGNLGGEVEILTWEDEADDYRREQIRLKGGIFLIAFPDQRSDRVLIGHRFGTEERRLLQEQLGPQHNFLDPEGNFPYAFGWIYADINQLEKPILGPYAEGSMTTFDLHDPSQLDYAPMVNRILLRHQWKNEDRQSFQVLPDGSFYYHSTREMSLLVFDLDEAEQQTQQDKPLVPLQQWNFTNSTASNAILSPDGQTVLLCLDLQLWDAQQQAYINQLVFGELALAAPLWIRLCVPQRTIRPLSGVRYRFYRLPGPDKVVALLLDDMTSGEFNWYAEYTITKQSEPLSTGGILSNYPYGALPSWHLDLPEAELSLELFPKTSIRIAGCSFQDLHPAAGFTESDQAFLRNYGALFTWEDVIKWRQFIHQLEEE